MKEPFIGTRESVSPSRELISTRKYSPRSTTDLIACTQVYEFRDKIEDDKGREDMRSYIRAERESIKPDDE